MQKHQVFLADRERPARRRMPVAAAGPAASFHEPLLECAPAKESQRQSSRGARDGERGDGQRKGRKRRMRVAGRGAHRRHATGIVRHGQDFIV